MQPDLGIEWGIFRSLGACLTAWPTWLVAAQKKSCFRFVFLFMLIETLSVSVLFLHVSVISSYGGTHIIGD